jgi:hypothetical protein
MGERPRRRAIAIPRQCAAQRFNEAAMLQQEGGCDGRVAGVGVEDAAVLGCGQKYFRRLLTGSIKETDPSSVGEATMLELQHKVGAPVRQSASFWGAVH